LRAGQPRRDDVADPFAIDSDFDGFSEIRFRLFYAQHFLSPCVASIIHYRHSMSRTLEDKKEKKENCRKLLWRKDLGLRGGG